MFMTEREGCCSRNSSPRPDARESLAPRYPSTRERREHSPEGRRREGAFTPDLGAKYGKMSASPVRNSHRRGPHWARMNSTGLKCARKCVIFVNIHIVIWLMKYGTQENVEVTSRMSMKVSENAASLIRLKQQVRVEKFFRLFLVHVDGVEILTSAIPNPLVFLQIPPG